MHQVMPIRQEPDPRLLSRDRTELGFSRFLGGFECSTKVRADGRRLDLLESTRHAAFCGEDYRALRKYGISAARDGLRWHLIERAPGCYDWSSFLPMLRASQACGIDIIWDLCHYGWPEWLDIWSPEFVSAFARFAAEAARVVGGETDNIPAFCAINEISFWAWAGGEVGQFAPGCENRGAELKRQLVRASLAATRAVREVSPRSRFLHAEPLIHVAPRSPADEDVAAAEGFRLAQFEALDILMGRRAPDLGGDPDCVDIVGVNFYPDNQWYHGGATIPLGHHAYRPLRDMLSEIHERYGRPLLVAETGAEGGARAAWLHYVAAEVAAAERSGTHVGGICLYPILDYPGWDNERVCSVGLFSMPDDAGRRRVDAEFAAEIARQQALHSHVQSLTIAGATALSCQQL